jgi:ABC-type branched-subunit amino acid transport system substrate-binding protein
VTRTDATKRRRLFAVAIAAAALIAGCSSSGSSGTGSSPTATTAATTAAATGAPLIIGQMAPVGTAQVDYSGAVAAARAAIRAINAGGGVDGHPLKLDFCNEQNNANTAAACARRFVSEGAVAMSGGEVSITGEAQVSAITQKAGLAQVGDNALSAWVAAPNEFPVVLYIPSVFADMPACNKLGYNKVAVTANENVFGQTFTKWLTDTAKKIPGMQLTTGSKAIIFSSTASDVTAPTKTVLDKHANCIDATGVFPQQEILMLKAMNTFGADPHTTHVIYGTAGADPSQLKQIAPLASKYLIGVSVFPGLSAASKSKTISDFISEMTAEKAAGDTQSFDVSNGIAVRDGYFMAWIAVHALADVMRQEHAITRAAVLHAMQTVQNVQIADFLPPWTPTKPGPTKGYPHLPYSTYFVIGYHPDLSTYQLLPDAIDSRPYLQ